MLKLTPLAIGLLTVISIAPKSQAMTTNVNPTSLQQPAGDLHAQVFVNIGDRPKYVSLWDVEHRRQLEIEREREARARWEAEHRRHEYYSQHNHRLPVGEDHHDRDRFHGEYHRDR